MKKTISLLAVLMMVYCSNAQNTSFGVKAGLNIASVEATGNDLEGKAGLYLGGLAHIHLNQRWAFQPELVYSMQGGKDDDFTLKLDYVNIPLLLQYMTPEGLRLQTGPQIGFLVKAKQKVGDVEVDVKDEVETTELAWTLGAGYLFPEGWGIDLRFNVGLTNVNEDDDYKLKNRVIQLGVFYQFMQQSRHRKRK